MPNNMSLKKATLINSVAKYYTMLCAFVVHMILSRILTPPEYGIVAAAMVFITFFTLFSDMGFGVAYIQNREFTADDRNVLFTFLTYVGAVLFVVFYFFAYGIAWFYGSLEYIPVAQLLGVNLFLTAVNVIPNAELLKQQRFKTVAITSAVAATVSSVIAVLLALRGFSYFSIVLQSVIYTLLSTIVFIYVTKSKFLFRIRFEPIQKITGISLGQLSFNFINYFSRNVDNLLIGKIVGSTALGYYEKAYRTTTFALFGLSSIIGSSIQPVLAVQQDDKQFVYGKFQKVFLFLAVIGAYLAVAFNLAAPEIIAVLYGDQWDKSVTAFSYLALSLFAQLPLNITGAFFQVLNNTRLLATVGVVSAMVLVSGIIVGLLFGTIEAVALGFLVGECINFFVVLWIMEKLLFKTCLRQFNMSLVKILLIAFSSYFVINFLFSYLKSSNIFFSLIYKMSFSFIIYFCICYIMRLEQHVISVFYPKYQRK